MYRKSNTPSRPYLVPITEVIDIQAEQSYAVFCTNDTLPDMENNDIFDESFDSEF